MNSTALTAMPFQRIDFADTLIRRVITDFLRDFHRTKCGPHIEQKCATLAESFGRVSS
jgi:hypothetical protein